MLFCIFFDSVLIRLPCEFTIVFKYLQTEHLTLRHFLDAVKSAHKQEKKEHFLSMPQGGEEMLFS